MIIDKNGYKHVEIGDKYGRLTVIEEAPKHREPNGHLVRMFRCKCDCGNETIVAGHSLTRSDGAIKSCGCIKIDYPAGITHGLSKTAVYRHYIAMKSRCTNINASDYYRYGGRGIKICNRWLDPEDGFMNFYTDMAPTYVEGWTLDRINNEGDYCPENCRWAPKWVQSNNTRKNVHITLNNETMTMTNWIRAYGVNENVARTRLKRGWPIEEVFRGRQENPNPINVVYFLDEFGSPIPQDQIKD